MRQWASRLGLTRAPTALETLAAHLRALLQDADARPPTAGAPARLPLVDPRGPRCVAVELGLSRVELYKQPAEGSGSAGVRLEAYLDALLLRGPEADDPEPLRAAGAQFDAERGTLSLSLPAGTRAEQRRACQTAHDWLVNVLEAGRGPHLSVALERRAQTANSELKAKVVELVRRKDAESRRVVYQQIVEGRFYLPVKAPPEGRLVPEPASHADSLGGRAVWAIYSDSEALSSSGHAHALLLPGVRVVQLSQVYGLGALQLNPGASYGGELYAHELDSIAGYLATLGLMEGIERREGVLH